MKTTTLGAMATSLALTTTSLAHAWVVDQTSSLVGVGTKCEVAIDSDTILVGEPVENVAHVFTRTGGDWVFQQTLTPSVAGETNFGTVIALEGDLAAVAGADSTFVFARSGGSWTEEANLGKATALSLDGDRLAIGHAFEDIGEEDGAGIVRMYQRNAGSWSYTGAARETPAVRAVKLGYAVDLSGTTLLASAPFGLNNSRILVFEQSAGTWSSAGVFSGGDDIGFEKALARSGDLVIAGDPNADTNSGQVFALTLSGTSLTSFATVTPGSTLPALRFGARVAVDGDLVVIGGSPVEIWNHAGGTLTYDFTLGSADLAAVGVEGTTVVVDGTVYELVPGDPDGTPCTTADRCESGHCVDGVCCESACGGGVDDCQACSVAASGTVDGTCTPVPDGTSCDNDLVCDGAEQCMGGACTAGSPPSCDDGDPCTTDACEEPDGCTHTEVPACMDASVPDDGGTEAGALDSGQPDAEQPDAEQPDGEQPDGGSAGDDDAGRDAAIPDAARRDAAVAGGEEGDGGCSCRTTTGRDAPAVPLSILLVAGAVALRRRGARRSGKSRGQTS